MVGCRVPPCETSAQDRVIWSEFRQTVEFPLTGEGGHGEGEGWSCLVSGKVQERSEKYQQIWTIEPGP